MGADVPLRPKDWGVYRSWGRLLAASGYVAIAFNHRLGFPEPLLAEADQDLGRCRRRSGRNLVRSGRTLAHRAGGLQRGWAAHQKYLAPDAVAAFSPAAQLRTPVARRMPFFLARAGKDTIPDILPGIDAFVAESLVAGTTLTLFNHPEAPHGFDHDPDARTREVLLAFLAFLATHLSPGAAAG